jgi:hypothetical protein
VGVKRRGAARRRVETRRAETAPRDKIRTVVGEIEVERAAHLRCANCVRFRPSRQAPGKGYCSRPLYDAKGRYTGRANDLVADDHWCEAFLSRLGEQQ